MVRIFSQYSIPADTGSILFSLVVLILNLTLGSHIDSEGYRSVFVGVQIIKGKRYTFSVDWWSYGVLCYEMITGQVSTGDL